MCLGSCTWKGTRDIAQQQQQQGAAGPYAPLASSRHHSHRLLCCAFCFGVEKNRPCGLDASDVVNCVETVAKHQPASNALLHALAMQGLGSKCAFNLLQCETLLRTQASGMTLWWVSMPIDKNLLQNTSIVCDFAAPFRWIEGPQIVP